jgi:hypothetical protein
MHAFLTNLVDLQRPQDVVAAALDDNALARVPETAATNGAGAPPADRAAR